jgi:hypothetical protein
VLVSTRLAIGVPNAGKVLSLTAVVSSLLLVSACSSVQGYPNDPENSTVVLASLSTYFDPSLDQQYDLTTDPLARQRLRDTIVLNRMRAYDIEFDSFERSLYGEANYVEAGGNLVVTALGAVGATSGGLVTKAALNAASGAITGAQGIISKELYYQRTIPALISQMEADRTVAKTYILLGLKQPDSAYSLVQAYADLESLKNAGGIPRAISTVTQTASSNAKEANQDLQIVSTSSFTFSSSASRDQIRAWLYPGGVINAPRRSALLAWMAQHGIKTSMVAFLSDKQFESQRQKAIHDPTLSITH